MDRPLVRVLLIEDNPGDVRLVREALREPAAYEFELTQRDRLSVACDWLESHECDLVLLDLSLPDSTRLEGLERVRRAAPDAPIVVLTASKEDELTIAALQSGAQDYLLKQQTEGPALIRAILYSIERQRLQNELIRQRTRQERELLHLERYAHNARTSVTGRVFNQGPLRDAVPEAFAVMVSRYSILVERSLRNQTHKTRDDVSDDLRRLGEELGFMKATPRDVVDLHTAALRGLAAPERAARVDLLTEEARLLIIELMGHVASYYRKYAVAFLGDDVASATQAPSGHGAGS